MFIFERAREHEQGSGRERERETQNSKQAPGSQLSAQSPVWVGLKLPVRPSPELKSYA